MKILYSEHVELIQNTAKSVQVLNTCAALTTCGVDVSLSCLLGSGSMEAVWAHYGVAPRFPVRRYRAPTNRILRSAGYRAVLGVDMARRAYDVLYTRDLGLALIASVMQRPFAYEIHSMPVRPQQQWMLDRLAQSANLLCMTPISHKLADRLRTLYPALAPRIVVVPCSANPGADARNNIEHLKTRPLRRIGYVGHLYPGKGGEMIFDLAEALPDYRFDVIGEVNDGLLDRRRPPNLILHGVLSHVDAMARLADCDCAIAPYKPRTEAVDGKVISDWFSPLKIFEYMANGIPIVASHLATIEEVIDDGRNGLLVEANDIAAWSAAIARLADDATLRVRLATNGLQDIEDRYSYRARANAIVAAIRLHARRPLADAIKAG